MNHFYAQILGGVCVGVTQAASELTGPEVVEIDTYDETLLGRKYDGSKFLAAEKKPASRRLSRLGFMNAMTDAELKGIYAAAKVSVDVEVWLAKFNAATPDADGTSVDLDDPRTIAGLQGLEAAGLLGAGRAAAILAGPK